MKQLQEVLRICPARLGQAVDSSGVTIDGAAILAMPTELWQVQDLVRLAANQDMCIVPRGMGSARSGGTAAVYDGSRTPIVIDLTSNRDVEVDVLRHTISVGCGTTNEEVIAAASTFGLFYPVECYRHSTVGGNIATDAFGNESLAYGTTKDQVLGLTMVLPDGNLLTTRSSVAPMGVDLTRLFVGSEGTLGICWSATLRLLDAPERTYTHIVGFTTHEAMFRSADILLRQHRGTLTALDFLDSSTTSSMGSEYMKDHKGLYVLLARSSCENLPGFARVPDRDADFLWSAYQDLMRDDAVRVVVEPTDAELLHHYVRKLAALHWCKARMHGSVGLGIFHVVFSGEDSKMISECSDRTRSYVMSMLGGSLAVEGLGTTGKEIFVAAQTDAARLNLKIKMALDPLGIMNPGKVL